MFREKGRLIVIFKFCWAVPFEYLVVFSSSSLHLLRALIYDLSSTSVKEMDQNKRVM